MRIHTNDTNKIIHKELSYRINGILFSVHNNLGRFCKEKQYADKFEEMLKESGLKYEREKQTDILKNKPDFVVEDKIVIEMKAKSFPFKEDYYQTQRYLKDTGLDLGLLVNFRNKYLKPIRIIRTNS